MLCKIMFSEINEEEARKIRRAESSSQHLPDSNLDRKPRSDIESDERKPIGANRTDGAGGKQPGDSDRGEAASGKIVADLITEYRDQIEANRQENIALEAKIQHLEKLQTSLEAGIQE
jgi:hypothetical protein